MIVSSKQQVADPGLVVNDFYLIVETARQVMTETEYTVVEQKRALSVGDKPYKVCNFTFAF